MKISFDFDGVLDREDVQAVASQFIADGHDVYILTARYADGSGNVWWGANWNDDLKEVAGRLGIPEARCLFSGDGTKGSLAREHGIELHIDDDMGWVSDVRAHAMCVWFTPGRAERCLIELQRLAR